MNAYISGIGWVFPSSYGNKTKMIYRTDKSILLPKLTRKDVLEEPYKPFGRMDSFSKLGFAAISYALMDAGLEKRTYNNNSIKDITVKGDAVKNATLKADIIKENTVKENIVKKNTAMIASTVLGCLDTDVNYYRTVIADKGNLASPALFAYTLPNCFLGEASIYYGFTGENFIINEGKTRGLRGLSMALELLETGISDVVLCGICDTKKPDVKTLDVSYLPGSLFFVLEKEKREDSFCYGKLEDDGNKNILYDRAVISNLVGLGEACLDIKFWHPS